MRESSRRSTLADSSKGTRALQDSPPSPKAVILAAGLGSRLGQPHPKALTVLASGKTILQHQLESLERYFTPDDIFVVVGFKNDLVMEAAPHLGFVYNEAYDRTNTSKSLLRALRKLIGHDVVWMNGDVVMDHEVLKRILHQTVSAVAVNTAAVGEEEIKYRIAPDGWITEISKKVVNGLGEAVGVNKVRATDIPMFLRYLEQCEDQAYFERAIELAACDGLRFYPVDVTDLICMEIDFVEDLERANRQLTQIKRPGRD
jgi:L-glutamine-phosphate cytidylyltransferase